MPKKKSQQPFYLNCVTFCLSRLVSVLLFFLSTEYESSQVKRACILCVCVCVSGSVKTMFVPMMVKTGIVHLLAWRRVPD
ncbi:hypothetical protein BDB00DRAFT_126963 [Zychaea mexicana]|uniref:uncharacterized protein n=1 Tax=Zychaea mexicana TaxID=64656 RepID=UPI0022FEDAE4|nr:uncharacterized protein BDB00DRAFT_126963 [Zychaea mexicana]KAI9484615.1 hypothetical protein BDB00DRAFT_126963 [Zychaea mexicana]